MRQFNQVAQAKWDELHALKTHWPLHELDQLAAYCAAYSRWEAAERYLTNPANGPVVTIEDDKGGVKSHGVAPEVKVSEAAAKEMARIAKLLRLGRL
jgi:phage terminase small subunit